MDDRYIQITKQTHFRFSAHVKTEGFPTFSLKKIGIITQF